MTNDPSTEQDDTSNLVTYIFDAHNRLVATHSPEGQVTSFFYDTEGRRIDNPKPDPSDDAPDEPHIVG